MYVLFFNIGCYLYVNGNNVIEKEDDVGKERG